MLLLESDCGKDDLLGETCLAKVQQVVGSVFLRLSTGYSGDHSRNYLLRWVLKDGRTCARQQDRMSLKIVFTNHISPHVDEMVCARLNSFSRLLSACLGVVVNGR